MQNAKLYSEAPTYCHYFFDLIESDNFLEEFENSRKSTLNLIENIPLEKENYAYQEGKWTVKEVFKHIIDCERIFIYRALRFARFDATPLPGFDENAYMANQDITNLSLFDLKNEYNIVRESAVLLYKNLNDDMLDFKGRTNGMNYSARIIAFMIIGHNLHHIKMIQNKYL